MNPKLKALLEAEEERYPHSLELKFKRILDKIAELWGTPMLDGYFEDLLIDKRGDIAVQKNRPEIIAAVG